ncbi:MAG: hypothetical protein QM765_35815 [Myxococcales bacterium]
MPARILVFCKKSVDHVTAKMVTEELKLADLCTLAETLDLPEGEEAAVDAMWEQFQIASEGGSLNGAELHWHASQRPVQVRVGPPVAGELEETMELLPKNKGGKRVRSHLEQTRFVVEFEMGIDGSNHLAATISEVTAFLFAEQGDGLVWFFHREFAAPDDRGATLCVTR